MFLSAPHLRRSNPFNPNFKLSNRVFDVLYLKFSWSLCKYSGLDLIKSNLFNYPELGSHLNL